MSQSFPAGTKVRLKKDTLDSLPHLIKFTNKVFVVSNDISFSNELKVYMDTNGGYITNSFRGWELANPIWLDNKTK